MNNLLEEMIKIEKGRKNFGSNYYFKILECKSIDRVKIISDEINLYYDYYILSGEQVELNKDYMQLLKLIINKLLELENKVNQQPPGFDEIDN